MNNMIKYGLIFAIGSGLGSIVTYKIVKDTYEQIAQKEINIIKEEYKKKEEKYYETEPDSNGDTVPKIEKVNNITSKSLTPNETLASMYKSPEKGPMNYSELFAQELNAKDSNIIEIDPEEFGDEGQTETTFILWADGILADEMDEKVEGIEEKIGENRIKEFLESDDQEMYIRNTILNTDYQIVKEDKRYSDIERE